MTGNPPHIRRQVLADARRRQLARFIVAGMSTEESARLLGMTIGTVRRMYRNRQVLVYVERLHIQADTIAARAAGNALALDSFLRSVRAVGLDGSDLSNTLKAREDTALSPPQAPHAPDDTQAE